MSGTPNSIPEVAFREFAYRTSRKRGPVATAVLSMFSNAVCSLMVTSAVDRDELFERYDQRLSSYGDRLVLFTLATLPSVAALAAIYVSFRGIRGIRTALSL